MDNSDEQNKIKISLATNPEGTGWDGYDLADVAKILHGLNKEFRRWAIDDREHTRKNLSFASGVRPVIYDWKKGSIDLLLCLMGNMQFGISIFKFAKELAHNVLTTARQDKLPDSVTIIQARNYYDISAGRDVHIGDINGSQITKENWGIVKSASREVIESTTLRSLEGALLEFCLIDKRPNTPMQGIIKDVDDSARRVLFRREQDRNKLLEKIPFPFDPLFKADVVAAMDKENRVRHYTVLRLMDEVHKPARH